MLLDGNVIIYALRSEPEYAVVRQFIAALRASGDAPDHAEQAFSVRPLQEYFLGYRLGVACPARRGPLRLGSQVAGAPCQAWPNRDRLNA